MKKSIAITIPAFLGAVLLAVTATSSFAGEGNRVRIECRATGPGDTQVDARYERRKRRTKFDGTYEADPVLSGNFAGEVLDVTVAGATVGTVTLQAAGVNGDLSGDIEFDSRQDELNPFPANFPQNLARGDVVTIGTLGCELR